jgi:hypothetical protein
MMSYKLRGTGLVVLLDTSPRLQKVFTMNTIHTQINPYTFNPSPYASSPSKLKLYSNTYRIQDQKKTPRTLTHVSTLI